MKSAQTTGLVVAIVIAAAAAGFGAYEWLQPAPSGQPLPQPIAVPALSPQQAMALSLNDLDGNPHALDEWRGKLRLVNFWATWCPPCREEMPLLVKLQAKYAASGLEVIGIATDDPDTDGIRRFTRHLSVNYPVLLGNDQVTAMVAGLGGNLIGLPYTLLIAPDGRLIRIHPGQLNPAETEAWIKAALAPGKSSSPAN